MSKGKGAQTGGMFRQAHPRNLKPKPEAWLNRTMPKCGQRLEKFPAQTLRDPNLTLTRRHMAVKSLAGSLAAVVSRLRHQERLDAQAMAALTPAIAAVTLVNRNVLTHDPKPWATGNGSAHA